MSFLLPICDGTSKILVNLMAFAFIPISTWIDPLAAFALKHTDVIDVIVVDLLPSNI